MTPDLSAHSADLYKMGPAVAAVFFLLFSQAMSSQICQPPKSVGLYYMTETNQDMYVAQDFEQGKILVVNSNNGHDDDWSYVDLTNNRVYVNSPGSGCHVMGYSHGQEKKGYELFWECLPDDAKLLRSGAVDFYFMERPGINWLVGVEPIAESEFFTMHFTKSVLAVSSDLTVVERQSPSGILYQFSAGISDPTVFDKDLSGCVAA
ncbi:hypothetical protein RRG08_061005 [Elysia crispata]|uniref:Uncharacterized protein n=1 Tax=Elysia crispata TaxID=231223 RepID=A0AAE1AV48_9GAST|nr:hypothetical protein RRG08_061005 [Elysia crispata]